MSGQTIHKSERLKSRKAIEALFRSGRTITSPPLKLLYKKVSSDDVPCMMTVAVPKKMIKRAVDRNLLKRRMREAYRLNKHKLKPEKGNRPTGMHMIFVYQSTEIFDYQTINRSVAFLITRFLEFNSH